MTTQSSQSVLINGFGVLFVILNAFGLGLRLPVGKLLAQAFAHWKIAVWALVINFVIIPLLFIGYLLTIASSIPGEIKVGFCVAAPGLRRSLGLSGSSVGDPEGSEGPGGVAGVMP